MYLNTRIFPTTGYARVLLYMYIRRELGGTGTEFLFQFTYCGSARREGQVEKKLLLADQTESPGLANSI